MPRWPAPFLVFSSASQGHDDLEISRGLGCVTAIAFWLFRKPSRLTCWDTLSVERQACSASVGRFSLPSPPPPLSPSPRLRTLTPRNRPVGSRVSRGLSLLSGHALPKAGGQPWLLPPLELQSWSAPRLPPAMIGTARRRTVRRCHAAALVKTIGMSTRRRRRSLLAARRRPQLTVNSYGSEPRHGAVTPKSERVGKPQSGLVLLGRIGC